MKTIGRYEVVRPLGRGGMGQVFLGRDPKLERSVALKLLNREADNADMRALFEREAKALAALSHPNIVTIFEIAEHEGRQFIAMEYLPGKSLRELLLLHPARDQLMSYCAQVATALAAAHAAKILHRDIKPENVVVGDGDIVKVVDFGIARRLGRPSVQQMPTRKTAAARATELVDAFMHTMPVGGDTVSTTAPFATGATITADANTVFGTPAYMAPEVLMGEESSPASDVYSLGVMVYECLTGKRPYEAPELHAVIARAIDGEEHPARLDDPLGELVEQMIDRDPTKRPALPAIARSLSRHAASTIAPRSRPRRRWWLPALAIAAIGIGGFAIWRSRATHEEKPPIAVADRGPIAIQNITLASATFAPNAPDPTTFARFLAELIAHTGVRVIGPEAMSLSERPTDAEWEQAAIAQNAMLIARGQIIEQDGRLVASFKVIDLRGGASKEIAASSDLTTSATLFESLAGQIAEYVKPGVKLDRTPNHGLAVKFFERGQKMLSQSDWSSARAFFEQAVAIDPAYVAAWEELAYALVRAARSDLAKSTRARAVEKSPEGPSKQILHAAVLIDEQKFTEVFAVLDPLENVPLSPSDRNARLFYLGEGHWHEGRHDRGYAYFKRILDDDPTYLRAAQHAGEYAVARRMEEPARRFLAIQQFKAGHIDFALRRYEKLAEGGDDPYRSWARVVLDDPRAPPPLEPRMMVGETIALAAGADDRKTLARAIPALIEQTRASVVTGVTITEVSLALESMIIAGLADHARDLLAALRRFGLTYHYRRLAIVAGPLVGPPKFRREELTERLVDLAEAIDAELAGNHARAAELLGALVRNPTWEWEYPERMALVRNLRKLGRTKEAAEICLDSLEPAVMRHAYRTVRRICGALGVRRGG